MPWASSVDVVFPPIAGVLRNYGTDGVMVYVGKYVNRRHETDPTLPLKS